MMVSLRALRKALKRNFWMWMVAGVALFCWLAVDTNWFTRSFGWTDWYRSEMNGVQ